jgi:hypothetical protein
MTRPEQRLITTAILTRLAGLTVYRGEVPDHPPILPDSDRTAPYVVLYPFGPKDGPDGNLADTVADIDYTGQLTCVAGFVEDCEFLTSQVDALMNRWVPVVAGVVFGAFRPPPGFDPGPVQRDPDVRPPRFFVPLQYQTTATT